MSEQKANSSVAPREQTKLLLVQKKVKLRTDANHNHVVPFEVQGFLTFSPSYYSDFPVTSEVFEKVELGRFYTLDVVEIESGDDGFKY